MNRHDTIGTWPTLLLAALSACGGKGDEAIPPGTCRTEAEQTCSASSSKSPEACLAEAVEACATEYYFRSFEARTGNCPAANPFAAQVRGKLRARLFRGTEIGEADVRVETHGLQRYFAPYELWFHAPADPAALQMAQVIVADEATLRAALQKAGLSLTGALPAADRDRAIKIISEVMFAPLREFIQTHSMPPDSGEARVVVVRQIMDPAASAILAQGGEVGGLGLSSPLLKSLPPSSSSMTLYDLIGIDREFTPTLFVGHTTIMKYLKYPDSLVAHEMGHALGLQHSSTVGDLMYPGVAPGEACSPPLTTAQVGAMQGFDAMAATIRPRWGAETLVPLFQEMVRRVLGPDRRQLEHAP